MRTAAADPTVAVSVPCFEIDFTGQHEELSKKWIMWIILWKTFRKCTLFIHNFLIFDRDGLFWR